MTTVAVFGGSFNPPHISHQLITLMVLETTLVDEVVWVPTARHAFGKELAPFLDRVEMCRIATARFGDVVSVSKIEAALPGDTSRTLYTLEALASSLGGKKLRLVIGADILADIDHWYRWDRVVELAPPLVVRRSGFDAGSYEEEALPEVPTVSSTDIRNRIAAGNSALPFVSRSIMGYIEEQGLYR